MDGQVIFFIGNYGGVSELEVLPSLSKRWNENARYWERLLRTYADNNAPPEKVYRTGSELIRTTPTEKDEGGEVRGNLVAGRG